MSSVSNAQNRVGNGGDAVICPDKSPILLDLYEATETLITSSKTDPYKIVQDRLSLLVAIAPKLATQYTKKLVKMSGDIEFKPDIQLVNIKDSKHLSMPKNCSLKQVAIRKNAVTQAEKLFLFDKDIWDKMDSLNQAALLMHEIIYDHFYKLDEKDSVKARKINVLLFSEKLTKANFWGMIKDLQIPIYP